MFPAYDENAHCSVRVGEVFEDTLKKKRVKARWALSLYKTLINLYSTAADELWRPFRLLLGEKSWLGPLCLFGY